MGIIWVSQKTQVITLSATDFCLFLGKNRITGDPVIMYILQFPL